MHQSIFLGNSTERLARGVSWAFVANVVNAASTALIVVLIARFQSSGGVGLYALGFAVVEPIASLLSLQLRGLQATDGKRDVDFGVYLTLRLLTIALMLCSLIVIYKMGTYSETEAWIIFAVMAKMAVSSAMDIYLGLLQQNQQIESMSRITIIVTLLSFVSFIATLWFSGSLVLSLLAQSATQAVIFVSAFSMTLRSADLAVDHHYFMKLRADRQQMTTLLSYAIPMGIVSLLISINMNIPRWALVSSEGLSALGVFYTLASFVAAADLFSSAFTQNLTPRLAQLYADGQQVAFKRLTWRIQLAIIIAAALAVPLTFVFGSRILSVVVGEEFLGETHSLTILALASFVALSSTFYGSAVTIARKIRIQVITNLIVIAVLAGTSMLLIPDFGISGAAWVVLFGKLTRLAANSYLYRLVLREWNIDQFTT